MVIKISIWPQSLWLYRREGLAFLFHLLSGTKIQSIYAYSVLASTSEFGRLRSALDNRNDRLIEYFYLPDTTEAMLFTTTRFLVYFHSFILLVFSVNILKLFYEWESSFLYFMNK